MTVTLGRYKDCNKSNMNELVITRTNLIVYGIIMIHRFINFGQPKLNESSTLRNEKTFRAVGEWWFYSR